MRGKAWQVSLVSEVRQLQHGEFPSLSASFCLCVSQRSVVLFSTHPSLGLHPSPSTDNQGLRFGTRQVFLVGSAYG